MRFIERFPQAGKPLFLTLVEDKELPPEYDDCAMNFSLITEWGENVAAGRCSIYKESGGSEYMLISAIYVEGNDNSPTKNNPNKYSGLGQLLVFAAIKFGFEQGVATTILSPLDGSEGFYLKMGFYPKVAGSPNRMGDVCSSTRFSGGKLNPAWLNKFAKASFLNESFRGVTWAGSNDLICPKLKDNVLKSWSIV